jgi:hypothetical protein
MVTKGHRRLGRTIRILENSVEISAKESQAKEAEKKYREKRKNSQGPMKIHQFRVCPILRCTEKTQKNLMFRARQRTIDRY